LQSEQPPACKILLSPELTDLLAELGQFSSLVAGELTLIGWTEITAVDVGLLRSLSQAAVGEYQPLGHSRAAQPFTEAQGTCLSFLLRREPASGLGRGGHRWTV
jgi:hypothetical protein